MFPILIAAQLATTHCYTNSYGYTNCTTMAPSEMSPEPDLESSRAAGRAIGELLSGSSDRHVRSQMGKMLADGKCADAYQYALKKGRMDLAAQAQQLCANAPK